MNNARELERADKSDDMNVKKSLRIENRLNATKRYLFTQLVD